MFSKLFFWRGVPAWLHSTRLDYDGSRAIPSRDVVIRAGVCRKWFILTAQNSDSEPSLSSFLQNRIAASSASKLSVANSSTTTKKNKFLMHEQWSLSLSSRLARTVNWLLMMNPIQSSNMAPQFKINLQQTRDAICSLNLKSKLAS